MNIFEEKKHFWGVSYNIEYKYKILLCVRYLHHLMLAIFLTYFLILNIPGTNSLLNPKSAIFIFISESNSKFSAFRSLKKKYY